MLQAEHEYINIHPPPPIQIDALVTALILYILQNDIATIYFLN